jgi:hypothetical protein
VPQTGQICGECDGYVGSQVDVHVHGGAAYTASEANPSHMTVLLGCYVIAFGFGPLWSLWRLCGVVVAQTQDRELALVRPPIQVFRAIDSAG